MYFIDRFSASSVCLSVCVGGSCITGNNLSFLQLNVTLWPLIKCFSGPEYHEASVLCTTHGFALHELSRCLQKPLGIGRNREGWRV